MATKKKSRINVTPTGVPTQPGQITPNYNVNKPFGPGIPRETTAPSQPLATLDYKTFLSGRGSTKPLAIQFAKLTKNQSLLDRLTKTAAAPAGAPPAPDTGGVPAGSPPTVSPAPQTTADPSVGDLPASPGAGAALMPGAQLPMPKKFPTADVNALYAPAERMIASQRAAALAAQDKAFRDNLAFEQFIQQKTQEGNTALAGTYGTLSQNAMTSRQQSIDSINDVLNQAKLGAGGSEDLARLAGTTAGGQSNTLLQAGQAAQNAVPDLVAQAALKYGQDMTQVGAAQGRVMNDAAIRATQAALGKTADTQLAVDTAKADAGVKDVASQREYLVQAAQLDALNRFNAGKLSNDEYATQSKLYADLARIKTTRDVENLKAQTAAMVESGRMTRADAANLNKLAVEQMKQTGETNRTLLTTAAKNSVAGTAYGAKAVTLVNNVLRNQTQSVESQDRHKRGQTVTQIATDLKNSFVVGQTNPMPYSQAYDLISGIPKAGPEALKDPKFISWLKTQFPGG